MNEITLTWNMQYLLTLLYGKYNYNFKKYININGAYSKINCPFTIEQLEVELKWKRILEIESSKWTIV